MATCLIRVINGRERRIKTVNVELSIRWSVLRIEYREEVERRRINPPVFKTVAAGTGLNQILVG
jgi:hypothetical protein